ncbi:MAG: hypothetical protein M1838_004992 [Thelocarpon superellum]|nr:MAG: hypothetical protein M1838_004992 [Thelocarpon superellum]
MNDSRPMQPTGVDEDEPEPGTGPAPIHPGPSGPSGPAAARIKREPTDDARIEREPGDDARTKREPMDYAGIKREPVDDPCFPADAAPLSPPPSAPPRPETEMERVERVAHGLSLQMQKQYERVTTMMDLVHDVVGERFERLHADLCAHDTHDYNPAIHARLELMRWEVEDQRRCMINDRFRSYNASAKAPDHHVYGISLVKPDGAYLTPACFPLTLAEFWALKLPSRGASSSSLPLLTVGTSWLTGWCDAARELTALVVFYEIHEYQLWGGPRPPTMPPLPTYPVHDAVRLWPEQAHRALAEVLGIIYARARPRLEPRDLAHTGQGPGWPWWLAPPVSPTPTPPSPPPSPKRKADVVLAGLHRIRVPRGPGPNDGWMFIVVEDGTRNPSMMKWRPDAPDSSVSAAQLERFRWSLPMWRICEQTRRHMAATGDDRLPPCGRTPRPATEGAGDGSGSGSGIFESFGVLYASQLEPPFNPVLREQARREARLHEQFRATALAAEEAWEAGLRAAPVQPTSDDEDEDEDVEDAEDDEDVVDEDLFSTEEDGDLEAICDASSSSGHTETDYLTPRPTPAPHEL